MKRHMNIKLHGGYCLWLVLAIMVGSLLIDQRLQGGGRPGLLDQISKVRVWMHQLIYTDLTRTLDVVTGIGLCALGLAVWLIIPNLDKAMKSKPESVKQLLEQFIPGLTLLVIIVIGSAILSTRW